MGPLRYKSYNANANKHTNYYLYQILYQGFKKCQELQLQPQYPHCDVVAAS